MATSTKKLAKQTMVVESQDQTIKTSNKKVKIEHTDSSEKKRKKGVTLLCNFQRKKI